MKNYRSSDGFLQPMKVFRGYLESTFGVQGGKFPAAKGSLRGVKHPSKKSKIMLTTTGIAGR